MLQTGSLKHLRSKFEHWKPTFSIVEEYLDIGYFIVGHKYGQMELQMYGSMGSHSYFLDCLSLIKTLCWTVGDVPTLVIK